MKEIAILRSPDSDSDDICVARDGAPGDLLLLQAGDCVLMDKATITDLIPILQAELKAKEGK